MVFVRIKQIRGPRLNLIKNIFMKKKYKLRCRESNPGRLDENQKS